MNKQEFNKMMINLIKVFAEQSYCKRNKVGALLIGKNNNIISYGWNGTRKKIDDNCCEDENGKTHNHVIHAEENCLRKLWNSHEKAEMSKLYTTVAPCVNCASMLIDAEISQVFYINDYRKSEGIDLLEMNGITCIKFDDE